MRKTTQLFMIDGKPMLVPDADVEASYEDIDAADAGRDQAGFMHRIPVRTKVASWQFSYSHLTEEEKQYMESLFPESGTFLFTHPHRLDATQLTQSRCYRSKYAISWRSARLGLWNNYGFSIIQC